MSVRFEDQVKRDSYKDKYYIVALGSSAVGKSSVIRQAARGIFFEGYTPTVEDTFDVTMNIDGRKYVIDCLDTMGLDHGGTVPDRHLLRKQGYMIMYSLDDPDSYENARTICEDLLDEKAIDPENKAVLLVGNKSDSPLHSDGEEHSEDECSSSQCWHARPKEDAAEFNVHHTTCSATRPEDAQRVFRELLNYIIQVDVVPT